MGDSRFKIKNGLLVEAGPTEITGSLIAPSITGSLLGTASWAFNSVGGGSGVGGSGNTNRVAKFTAPTTIGDSRILDDGTSVQITGSTAFLVSVAAASTPSTTLTLNNNQDGGHRILFGNSATSTLAAIEGDISSSGAGTNDGVIKFWTATDGSMTEKMRITKEGRLGVNSTIPPTQLDVLSDDGVAAGEHPTIARFSRDNSAGAIYLGYIANGSALTATQIRTSNGLPISIGTSTVSQSLTIVDAGNVGIGTTSPSGKLHVNGGIILGTNTDFVLNSAGSGFIINTGASSGNTYSQIYAFQSGNTAYNNLVIPGGNVGISETSPSGKLEVYDNISFSTIDTFPQLSIKSATGTTGNRLNLGVDQASGLSFIQSVNRGTAATPLILQRYSGNVGIGQGATNPGVRLFVSGNIGAGTTAYNGGYYAQNGSQNIDPNWGFDFSYSTGVADDYSTRVKFYPAAGSTRKMGFYDSQNSAWIGYFDGSVNSNPNFIFSAGNVGIGATSPTLGTLQVNGNVYANSFTGSLLGTASYSLNGGSFDVIGSTLYSVNPRSGPNFSTTQSIYIGSGSGFDSRDSAYSVFVGGLSGYSGSNSYSSSFLGYRAGHTSRAATLSNMIGISAGESALSASTSNFIGYRAGYNANNANKVNMIGNQAGEEATLVNSANFIGDAAGYIAIDADRSNFLGYQAGFASSYAKNSNFIGDRAGYQSGYINHTNAIGTLAGASIGETFATISGSYNNMMGYYAGYRSKKTAYSNIMGFYAGFSADSANSIGKNNIIIGTNISLPPKYENGINIGGLIFGSGSYSNISSDTFSGSADGNIGIGTTNPQARLHVGAGNILLDNTNFISAKDTGGTLRTVLYGRFSDNATYLDGGTGGLFLRTNDAAVTAVYIDNTGKTGVGTTSPLTKLDVRTGVITAGSSTSTQGSEIVRGYYANGALAVFGTEFSTGGPVLGYAVKPSTSAAGSFLSSTSINIDRGAYTIGGSEHKWYTGSVQTVTEDSAVSMGLAMILTSIGRLGLGTASPANKLDVVGQGYFTGGVRIGADSTNNLIDDASNGAASTTLYIGNASINTTSDIRLKTNIVDTQISAVETLSKLRVVDFNWQDPTDTSWNNKNVRGTWTGLIAQEAIKHVPYIVNAPRDEETLQPIEDSTEGYWQIEYQHLVPILIKAIQEQQKEIEDLKNKINT